MYNAVYVGGSRPGHKPGGLPQTTRLKWSSYENSIYVPRSHFSASRFIYPHSKLHSPRTHRLGTGLTHSKLCSPRTHRLGTGLTHSKLRSPRTHRLGTGLTHSKLCSPRTHRLGTGLTHSKLRSPRTHVQIRNRANTQLANYTESTTRDNKSQCQYGTAYAMQ